MVNSMIQQIKRWRWLRAYQTSSLRSVGRRILDGLQLDTDAGLMEACRRYNAHLDDLKARRKQRRSAEGREEAWEAAVQKLRDLGVDIYR
jgi:hypothetical protein